jgi:hypothetical protein
MDECRIGLISRSSGFPPRSACRAVRLASAPRVFGSFRLVFAERVRRDRFDRAAGTLAVGDAGLVAQETRAVGRSMHRLRVRCHLAAVPPFSRWVIDATAATIQAGDPSGLSVCDEAR